MNIATIFNIQKFSVHDGPGIRTTVFFKGCPLHCMWCHNPESIESGLDMLYDESKCTLCGMCQQVCPTKAVKLSSKGLEWDAKGCTYCGECVTYCVNAVREIAGKKYTVDEVLDAVLKDKIFYEQSGGGVTLSGGEPLMQADFAVELLKRLKEENIHSAVDTSGAVSWDAIKRAAEYADLFLYDIKLTDETKHRKYIGASNKLIYENLRRLADIHRNINIRMPIIEGVNADREHIGSTVALMKELGIKKVNLLQYHDIAKHKYKKLGRQYEENMMAKPSDDKMRELCEIFTDAGMDAKIGG